MSQFVHTHFNPELDLCLLRTLACTPEQAYRCWTEPALIVQWFTPPPWRTVRAQMDVRPGGTSMVYMQGPAQADGTLPPEVPNPGLYLHVIPNERLIATNAMSADFTPVPKDGKPHEFALVIDLHFARIAGEPEKTAYTAIVRHWDSASKAQHEAMGFHAGWGIATEQLERLAKTL